MLIGLSQQISKIFNPFLFLPSTHPYNTYRFCSQSWFRLWFKSLFFLNRFHLYTVLATITSAKFAASSTLSTSKQHQLSLLLLYISIVHQTSKPFAVTHVSHSKIVLQGNSNRQPSADFLPSLVVHVHSVPSLLVLIHSVSSLLFLVHSVPSLVVHVHCA